jgi:CheY-like chemotaxis protein
MAGDALILLVEDNEGDVELTHRAIGACLPACRLAVANDGAEALEILQGEDARQSGAAPNIILLDLNMPRMDGKRFLEILKADQRLRLIPVIMLTSSNSAADIRACYERHVNCYVVKPFDGREFADAIAQIVSFWTGRAQLPASPS